MDRSDLTMKEVHAEFVPLILASDRSAADGYRSRLDDWDAPVRCAVGESASTPADFADLAAPMLAGGAWDHHAEGLPVAAEPAGFDSLAGDDDSEEDDFEDDDDDDDDLDDLDDDADDDEDDDDVEEDFDDDEG